MTEPAAGPSDPGTVVMELGGDTGALILYTPAGNSGAPARGGRSTLTALAARIASVLIGSSWTNVRDRSSLIHAAGRSR